MMITGRVRNFESAWADTCQTQTPHQISNGAANGHSPSNLRDITYMTGDRDFNLVMRLRNGVFSDKNQYLISLYQ